MNKAISIIITAVFIIVIAIVFNAQSKNIPESTGNQSIQNVDIKNGIQYITINAKGGYYPAISVAKANMPTKLIVKTKDTYDCSAALIIRS